MATPAAILDILLVANTAPANAALAKTQAQLQTTGKTAAATGATMKKAMLGIGVAAAAAGVALFKVGEEFDDAYDKIQTRTGATGREMRKLKGVFRDVVGDVPATFDEAATAVGDLNTRLGLSGRPLARMSKQMTELSRLTDTSLSGNVESVSKAFVDWEIRTKDMSKTLDGLFRLSQESGASVEEITSAVQKFGSPLRQLGFSFAEASAMWATFVRAGVNTQTMVPGLKLAISNLTRPTEELGASMQKLGINVGKPDVALQQIFDLLGKGSTLSTIEKTGLAMDVFGKRAGADMAEAIRQGRFEVDDMLKVFRKGEGTIREQGRRTMDLSEHWQQFTNLLKLQVEPIATDVFKGLGDLMKEVSKAFKQGGWEAALGVLVDKLTGVLPKIVEAGGEIGLALMKGIADAFIHGNILTKLFIGAGAIRLFGGAGVFGRIGGTIASKIMGGLSGKLGGLGGTIAGGLTARGTSPLNPVFVKDVGGGVGGGGPVGGGGARGGGVRPFLPGISAGAIALTAGAFRKQIIDALFPDGWANDALHNAFDSSSITTSGGTGGFFGDDIVEQITKTWDGIFGNGKIMGQFTELRGAMQKVSVVAQQMGLGLKITRSQFKFAGQGASFFGDSLLTGIDSVKRWAQAVRRNNDDVGKSLSGVGRAFKGLGDDTDKNLDRSRDHVGKFEKTVDTAQGKVGGDLKDMGKDVGVFAQKTDKHTDSAGKSFDKTTTRSGKMARGVGANVQALVNGVGSGLDILKDNLNKSLAAFKVKKVGYSIKKAGNVVGDVVGAQHGAIVPGTGSGDKVPLHLDGRLAAMVEPGELVSVANRTATERLMAVNKAVPRRRDGGVVPHLAKGGGLMAPFDVQGSKPGFVPFMNFLNNMYGPLYVMSGYRPGSITTSGNVSNHASGHAVDISTHESGVDQATGPGTLGGPGAARMDDLHSYMARNIKLPGDFLWRTYTGGNHYNHIHRGITSAEADDPRKMIAYLSNLPGGGAIAESLKRLILKGPKGPLREMGQGALDKAWRAANDFLSKQGPGYSSGKYLKGKGDIFTASWYGPTPATVGAAGVSLPGTMSFAELSDPPGSLNFSALGGLPYHAKIGVRYKGKAIEVEKLDVGAGGPGLGGHIRAIDLWEDAAKQLPGFMSAGIANVEVLRQHGGIVQKLAKGGILDFDAILAATRSHDNDPDKRKKAVKKATEQFKEIVKGFGLPEKAVKKLLALRHDADVFGEYAGYASSLSDEGVIGKFRGATEAEWTTKQLDALFKLRNRLISAKKLIERRITQQGKMLEKAEKQLKQTNRAISDGEDARDDLTDRLEKAKKAKNKELEKHLQDKLDSLDERQDLRKQVAQTLKNPVISSLKGLGGRLKSGGKEYATLTSIDEQIQSVQGLDAPMRKLKQLPAIGVLGGEIFDAQLTLKNLNAEANPVDTGIDLSELRSVIEAARFGVFDGLDTFHTGGIVPGSGEVPIVAKGGEGVFTADQMAAMGKGTTEIKVENNISVEGMDLVIETMIDGKLAKRERREHLLARQYR